MDEEMEYETESQDNSDLARKPLKRYELNQHGEEEDDELYPISSLEKVTTNRSMDPRPSESSKAQKKGKKAGNKKKDIVKKPECHPMDEEMECEVQSQSVEMRYTERSFQRTERKHTEAKKRSSGSSSRGIRNQIRITVKSLYLKVIPTKTFYSSGKLQFYLCCAGIACLALFMQFYINHYMLPLANTPVLNVAAIMSELKPDFERQPKNSIVVIRSSLRTVSAPEPTAPAIILLLAAEGAEELTGRIGRKLVEAVTSDYVHIAGSRYIHEDTNSGKKHIDDLLRTLNDEAYEAVLVEDLHLIPGAIALMLHSYCDHENAPSKRVVYVLTVASGTVIPKDSEYRLWDEVVRRRLNEAWNDIDEDQMEPLLTRLTVGVTAITSDRVTSDAEV